MGSMRESSLQTICAWCQRVRNHSGEWSERDLPEPAGRVASHGICPQCLERATARATMAAAPQ
jgi:hypothetical protein